MQKIIKFISAHTVLSLFAILFIALILRVILIDKIPGGLQSDESLIVYNAWSIAETGADVFGDKLPVHLKGYGWGENSFLVYLLVFLIKIFGPFNVVIFRLSIVFFHLLLILFSFLLARELFDYKIGLLTALLLAFSPWDLALSRLLLNVSILPCFYIIGIYLLIRGIKTKKIYFFIVSGVIFSFTFYIYALSFLWVPLLLLIMTVSFWPVIKQLKPKHFLAFTVSLLLLSLPIFMFYIQNQFSLFTNIDKIFSFSLPELTATRFDTVSIFNQTNESVFLIIFKNYFAHFDPMFLFFNATMPCFVRYFGLLQFYELPFLAIGLVLVLINSRLANYKFILFWLLAAPLAAALTFENIPHPFRFISALPVFEIIASLGFMYFFTNIIKVRKKLIAYIVSIAIVIITAVYLINFFLVYPKTSFKEQQANSQEISEYIRENYKMYDKFYVLNQVEYIMKDNVFALNREDGYIFYPYNYLYYGHISPRKIQEQKLGKLLLQLTEDRVTFSWEVPTDSELRMNDNILYLLPVCNSFSEFIKSKTIVKEFKDDSGQAYFVAVK